MDLKVGYQTEGLAMDVQLESFLNRVQGDIAANAKTWIPTPRKFDAESVVSAIVVMVGFYLASLVFKKVAEKFFTIRKVDEALARFLIRAVRLTLVGLGFVTALGTLGVDVSAIVAGLGLTGLALGIALKDAVSNAVSGIMLLLFRPFRHRDHIKVGEFEGTVHDIDLRYTHLRSEGRVIFVPNSMMFANAVSVIGQVSSVIASGSNSALQGLPVSDLPDDPPSPPPPADEPTLADEQSHEPPINLLMTLAEDRPARQSDYDRDDRAVAA